MILKIDKKRANVETLLSNRNVNVLDIENALNIFYVSFLIKDEQKKFCSMIVKFKDHKTINLALRKKLV